MKMKHKQKKRKTARALFTLIELLVVIAIIAMTLHSKSGFFMANYGKGAF